MYPVGEAVIARHYTITRPHSDSFVSGLNFEVEDNNGNCYISLESQLDDLFTGNFVIALTGMLHMSADYQGVNYTISSSSKSSQASNNSLQEDLFLYY